MFTSPCHGGVSVVRISAILLLAAAWLVPAIAVSAQDDASKAKITAAAERLTQQESFRWDVTVASSENGTRQGEGTAISSGRKVSGGYFYLTGGPVGSSARVVKDGQTALLVDDLWMTTEQAEARSPGRGAGRGGRGARGARRGGGGFPGQPQSAGLDLATDPPPADVLELLAVAVDFGVAEDTISATLPESNANELLDATAQFGGRGGRGGPGFGGRGGRGQGGGRGGRGARGGAQAASALTDVSGTIEFTFPDGVLSGYTIVLKATQSIAGNDIQIERRIAARMEDIGASELAIPLDARDIVDALAAGQPSPIFVPEPGFRSLFNGRDLAGWDGRQGFWSVNGRAIVGRTTAESPAQSNTFLIAKDGDDDLVVNDFELRFSYRITPNNDANFANSGVQYRSRREEDYVVVGYQADMEAGDRYSGILYDEGGAAGGRAVMAERGEIAVWNADGQKTLMGGLGAATDIQNAIRPGEWNEYVILAEGNHLQHFINGVQTIDVTDDASTRLTSGVLALQLHAGDPMTVEFKDLRIRPISPLANSAIASVEAAEGFLMEMIYLVPRESQGSWVASCLDDEGRMIVSDQGGQLYRLSLPEIGQRTPIEPEPLGVEIGGAHGLLYAFDSLYVMVEEQRPRGLYRVRDTDGDDRFDEVRLLRDLGNTGGEHGVHSVILGPDGQSLYIICGDQTQTPEFDATRVPKNQSEDHLLPRIATGFMNGVLAPGGWIARTDPEGKEWEMIASGFRNEFDAAFNRVGELFTYDADMEWDIGDPWYRPTRVNHVISGADFGWRYGAGKWPAYYLDSFGSVVDVGTGSPTGVTFGYGAKFPARYQDALYISDWSFGKIYAVHLTPDGSSYMGELEEFIAGQPLAVTDVIINPHDGAMYVIVGGRGTQSALYRVTYVGEQSTEPTPSDPPLSEAVALRRSLEAFHGRQNPAAVEAVWPHLNSEDRAIRHAARVALEWQDVSRWRRRALAETDSRTSIAALAALARASAKDQFHRQETDPGPDPALQPEILQSLARIDWESLSYADRVDLLRTYQLVFTRLGPPDEAAREALVARLDPKYPGIGREVNVMLANLLVYLQSPTAASKTMELLRKSTTQQEQIDFAMALRALKTGWTMPLREEYFRWFSTTAASFRGGNTFSSSLNTIRDDAVNLLSEQETLQLASIIQAPSAQVSPQDVLAARPLVKEWTLQELVPIVEAEIQTGRDFENGRRAFGAVACGACHRFNQEGGAIGPDLSNVVGRFSVRDLLESIVEPSKVISDQYGAVNILTNDGRIITGRVGNLRSNALNVVQDMFNPGQMINVDRAAVESIRPSTVSMMPEGLLNSLTAEEIQDLVAYLLSRGSPDDEAFQ